MNKKKLDNLFAVARNDTAPRMSADFATDVARAVRREPGAKVAESLSMWDHLNGLFPRIALAAAAVIVLCIAADWGFTAAGLPGVNDGAAQVSSQDLFAPEDL